MPGLTIGLTGGIASGKSLAGRYFHDLGVPVIDADQVSRKVVTPGSIGLKALVAHFGADILDADGGMDRRRMRERVFSNPQARLELEGILHPLIRSGLHLQRDAALLSSPAGYCVLMVPLLVKFGWADMVDRVLVVDCSEALQLSRLTARDDIDADLAESMLRAQDSRQQRLDAADDVIGNDGSPEELQAAVSELDGQYRKLALAVE